MTERKENKGEKKGSFCFLVKCFICEVFFSTPFEKYLLIEYFTLEKIFNNGEGGGEVVAVVMKKKMVVVKEEVMAVK
jgi:hypothetical protein